jgi:hypothetical protein
MGKTKPDHEKKIAMNFSMPTATRDQIESLASDSKISMSEVIRRSVDLYRFFKEYRKAGIRIIARRPYGDVEIVIPEFEVQE